MRAFWTHSRWQAAQEILKRIRSLRFEEQKPERIAPTWYLWNRWYCCECIPAVCSLYLVFRHLQAVHLLGHDRMNRAEKTGDGCREPPEL